MAVVSHLTDVDYHLNELLRARAQNVSSLPAATPANSGWLLYNTSDGQLYCSNGSTWTTPGPAGHAFEHVQATPQAVVTVSHNLGYRPSVTAFALDYATQFVGFTTQHLDANTLRVSMDNPQACVLVMS